MPSEETARPIHPGTHRVLCDVMLGKLSVYLRMCGYDTAYVADRTAGEEDGLRERARMEGRLLLSRDVELVDTVEDAVLLTERKPADQLDELRTAGFELLLPDEPSRCGRCNGSLEAVSIDVERPDYAPAPNEFDCWRCTDCGQFFWKGSHWDRIRSMLVAAT